MSGTALVVGASGGIGGALVRALGGRGYDRVVGLSRSADGVDLTDETAVATAVEEVAARGEIRLCLDATGVLHGDGLAPEKRLADLDFDALQRAFAVNASGPAMLMKHVLPRLPRRGRAVFATLSARVGSIGDNRLGGWYGYRASKAALNQILRSAAVDLARRAPGAICVALHPGTVETGLSRPFARSGLTVHSPAAAAANLLAVIDGLTPADTGGFFDWQGRAIPW